MGQIIQDESYRNAFNAAVAQRDMIVAEFERLKNRRILVEAAARALEPVVYPDEYRNLDLEQSSPVTTVLEISRPAAASNVEIWNPTLPAEISVPAPVKEVVAEHRPVQPITQSYVRGEGEPEEEIQRRINIAIGRSAAD
ncbi:MAG TPA: hypothetical protein VN753_16390 [Terracidiphilus sp.]|nr:hypothetical protein [Terracidiphilus sp.]